ncbi:MAG TPA: diguanylate cyclase [Bacillota bacterium]|nr:diguanylate cyclase [Bacillota bacterium]
MLNELKSLQTGQKTAGRVNRPSPFSTLPLILLVLFGIFACFAITGYFRHIYFEDLTGLEMILISVLFAAVLNSLLITWFYRLSIRQERALETANEDLLHEIILRNKTEERVKYLTFHDYLTGLYNRAYFEEEMHRLSTGRYDPVSIILCDIDGLKLVNDTMGHETGDSLLVAAASVIKGSFRDGDVVARIGGDEFAVLLPNSGKGAVRSACNRLRNSIKSYNEGNERLPLSISIGFSTRSDVSITMDELYKDADNNMYREKLLRTQSARSGVVQTLKKALGARDFITEGHADRMQDLVTAMAESMSLPDCKIADLRLLAQFHDIGKVGIPDSILFKPGPLTPEEYSEMKRHCEIGHLIAMSPPDLVPIADLILMHHEWWNGKGYPLELKGEEIPLECRILAIADAYDAMTSDRPYRKALSHDQAVKELRKNAGIQFDPYLVNRFVELLNAKKIKQKCTNRV